jgi:hypothetical protein
MLVVTSRKRQHAAHAVSAGYGRSESKRTVLTSVSFEKRHLAPDGLFRAIGRFNWCCREQRKRHTDDGGMRLLRV